MNTKLTVNQIVARIIENGLAKNNVEFANEFEFAASETGYTDEEIQDAQKSDWFPWFKE